MKKAVGVIALAAAAVLVPLSAASFYIAASRSATVPVALSRAALRRLERRGRLAARATAVARDAAETTKTTRARLALGARKK